MTPTAAPTRSRTTTLTLAAVAAAALAVPVGAATQANAAADATASDGTLTWGVKQSFRSYIAGPIANGEITTGSGASQLSSGEFEFTSATGTVEDDGSGEVDYSGSVAFYGHDGELDFTIADPQLTLGADGTGTLDVTYTDADGATSEVNIADVSGGAFSVSGDEATVTDLSTTLAEEGVTVFSYNGNGFYPEGEALDPLSSTVALGADTPDDTTDDDTTDDTTDDATDDTTDDATGDDATGDDTTGDDTTGDDATGDDATDDGGAGSGDATDDGAAGSGSGTGSDDSGVSGPVVETDIV
ncbi:hypothetical protein GCM10027055_04960 [Janibacter alkaliphilus]|uniref:Htaa domain-containing protein n=1 Tax=Janibacter alkaliphilus TaxID=1069963 RepID=A0A852XF75_9MICO|nr:hypothetical protein [Janibacter alkaliphilus]